MAKTDFKTVGEYLATLDPDVKGILTTVRQTIRKAVPQADEIISYQIPAYKLDGAYLVYFAAFKEHFTLSCPPPSTAFETFAKQLAPYAVSKSAIRFPLDEPVPVKLITAITKHRAKEALAAAKTKKPVKR